MPIVKFLCQYDTIGWTFGVYSQISKMRCYLRFSVVFGLLGRLDKFLQVDLLPLGHISAKNYHQLDFKHWFTFNGMERALWIEVWIGGIRSGAALRNNDMSEQGAIILHGLTNKSIPSTSNLGNRHIDRSLAILIPIPKLNPRLLKNQLILLKSRKQVLAKINTQILPITPSNSRYTYHLRAQRP